MYRLLFLLVSFSLFGQSVSITNSDVSNIANWTGANAAWIFGNSFHAVYGDSAHKDLTANNFDLTYSWSTYAELVDSMGDASPVYSGDEALYFDGNDYLVGDAGELSPGAGNATLCGWFKTSSSATMRIFNAQATNYWIIRTNAGKLNGLINSTAGTTNITSTANINDGEWHFFAFVIDQTVDSELRLYINGASAATDVSLTGGTINTSIAPPYIGRDAAGTQYFTGHIAAIYHFDSALSDADINRLYALGWNFVSTNGNVTRESPSAFYQTVYSDTIGIPLSDATLGTNQEFVFTSLLKDTDGAGTSNWWVGQKRLPKTSIKTITFGSSFVTKTAYFGDAISFSSDTLWVAVSDTIIFDNIVVKRTQHHLKSPANREWLGW